MTGTYREYRFEVEYKQDPSGAWFAMVTVNRPDGTPLGPYRPRTAHRDLDVVKQEARDFIHFEIERDISEKGPPLQP